MEVARRVWERPKQVDKSLCDVLVEKPKQVGKSLCDVLVEMLKQVDKSLSDVLVRKWEEVGESLSGVMWRRPKEVGADRCRLWEIGVDRCRLWEIGVDRFGSGGAWLCAERFGESDGEGGTLPCGVCGVRLFGLEELGGLEGCCRCLCAPVAMGGCCVCLCAPVACCVLRFEAKERNGWGREQVVLVRCYKKIALRFVGWRGRADCEKVRRVVHVVRGEGLRRRSGGQFLGGKLRRNGRLQHGAWGREWWVDGHCGKKCFLVGAFAEQKKEKRGRDERLLRRRRDCVVRRVVVERERCVGDLGGGRTKKRCVGGKGGGRNPRDRGAAQKRKIPKKRVERASEAEVAVEAGV